MNTSLLGAQITKFRKAAGLTQEDLGRAVGVTTQAVSRWENGGAPDVTLLPAIADKLHVTVDALFGREGGAPQDMGETLARWIRTVPEGTQLDQLCRLIFEAMKAVTFNNYSISAGYMLKSEMDTPDGNKAILPCISTLDEGQIVGVFAEDMPFAAVIPEPADGYAAHFASNDEYRRLFAALSQPLALEVMLHMASIENKFYTPGAVAKRMKLPAEQIEKIFSALLEANLLRQLDLESDTGATDAYAIRKDRYLVPFLYYARLMADPYGYNGIYWDPRKAPILRPDTK